MAWSKPGGDAVNTKYDNSGTGIPATDVGAAIDWLFENSGSAASIKVAKYIVTAGTTEGNATLTLSTGVLTKDGETTKSGETVTCGTSEVFNTGPFEVLINGVVQIKTTDIIFVSAGVLQIIPKLDVGDSILVKGVG